MSIVFGPKVWNNLPGDIQLHTELLRLNLQLNCLGKLITQRVISYSFNLLLCNILLIAVYIDSYVITLGLWAKYDMVNIPDS